MRPSISSRISSGVTVRSISAEKKVRRRLRPRLRICAHIAGNHTLAGDYQGKEAVFGFFGQLAERSGGTARLNLQKALTDDWFALVLVELAGRVGDETLDGERAVLVLRVQDGKFIEFWSHHYDQQKMDQVWS
jgi:hypothetical protein